MLNSVGQSTESTPELSFRPVLDSFLRDLAQNINPEIEGVFEPRAQKRAGRPDWRFHHRGHLGVYGYVEAKPLDLTANIKVSDFGQQIGKYLSLGHKLILTDGIDFAFVDSNGNSELISIVPKPSNINNLDQQTIDFRLENNLKYFFQDTAERDCSEEEIISEIAKRAKQLSIGVQELVAIPIGSGFTQVENETIEVLHRLYSILQRHHDYRLHSQKAFGDFVAQVLSFGLLLAHRYIRENSTSANNKKEQLERFWFDEYFNRFTDELSPFKALSVFLKNELAHFGSIGTWYQDSLLYLAHVRLDTRQINTPDYHTLFERFLDSFDPETRFSFGAFYTPQCLANYAVELSNTLANINFQTSIFSEHSKIIDPCCGTGTFIEAIFNKKSAEQNPFIVGFEILPAPYALAKYRVKSLSSENGLNNLKILLTNTLSDEINSATVEPSQVVGDPFLVERSKAKEFSCPPVTLVIGNPPSSDNQVDEDSYNESIIDGLLNDFRPPENERTSRQNIQKQISNPFVKFIRWSVAKVMHSGRGIVTLVVPSAFLTNRSYFWSRQYLLSKFSQIYILEIDTDLRSSEGDNLFNVKQGRALISCVFGGSGSESQIFYKSITSSSKNEKINLLNLHVNQHSVDSFVNVPTNAKFSFSPVLSGLHTVPQEYLIPLYKTAPSSNNFIFERHCNGLKLSPTAFFIHIKKELLVRRVLQFKRVQQENLPTMISSWFSGQAKPPNKDKLTQAVLASLPGSQQDTELQIKRYSFRPFLYIYALINGETLSELASTAGGGARVRPEVVALYENDSACAIAISPAPSEIGDEIQPFTSFCWGLPDNDLCTRGNSKILSDRFPEYKKPRLPWDKTLKMNINANIITTLSSLYEINESSIPRKVLFYIYGLLNSNLYLNRFKAELFLTAGESMPPIFFPKEKESFEAMSLLGAGLADLERHDVSNRDVLNDKFTSTFTAFNFSKFVVNLELGVIEFYGNRDAKLVISEISADVLKFAISGYNVIDTWLKFHKFSYTRTTFDSVQLKEFGYLIQSVESSINIRSQADDVLEEIMSGELVKLQSAEVISGT